MTNPILEFLQADKLRTQGVWTLCLHLETHDECGCKCGYRGGIWGNDGKEIVCEMGGSSDEGGIKFIPESPRKMQCDDAKFINKSSRIADPIKALVRDYAMMLGALSNASYGLNNVMLNADGRSYVLPLRSVDRSQERTQQALFAETHRELFQVAREE